MSGCCCSVDPIQADQSDTTGEEDATGDLGTRSVVARTPAVVPVVEPTAEAAPVIEPLAEPPQVEPEPPIAVPEVVIEAPTAQAEPTSLTVSEVPAADPLMAELAALRGALRGRLEQRDQPRDQFGRFASNDSSAAPADTEAMYKHADGTWDKARVRTIHEPSIRALIDPIPPASDGKPILYMTGGGYGSGKSTYRLGSSGSAAPTRTRPCCCWWAHRPDNPTSQHVRIGRSSSMTLGSRRSRSSSQRPAQAMSS
jgi:hypothetical protein